MDITPGQDPSGSQPPGSSMTVEEPKKLFSKNTLLLVFILVLAIAFFIGIYLFQASRIEKAKEEAALQDAARQAEAEEVITN